MTEEKTPNLFPILTSYAIAVSLFYLFGYWSTFDINILEYASLQDILKLGIYPVLIGVLGIILGQVVRVVLSGDVIKTAEPRKAFIIVGRRFAWWSSVIAILLIYASLFLLPNPDRWTVSGLLLAWVLIIQVDDVKALSPFIPNVIVRRIVIITAIMVLISSFTTAKINAHQILSGKNVKLISTQLFKEKGLLSGQDTLKHIGAAGDYFFFLSMDNKKTYAVKYSDLHYLEFTKPDSAVKETAPKVDAAKEPAVKESPVKEQKKGQK
jgi:hypothetical protein